MAELAIDILTLESHPKAAIVALSGAIDATTVVRLMGQITAARDRGVDRFILDMEKVTYVNSTGMGFLITLSDTTKGAGVPIVRVQPKVRVIFDMMNLGSIFRMHSSREAALAELGASDLAPTNGTVINKSLASAAPPPQVAASVACEGGLQPQQSGAAAGNPIQASPSAAERKRSPLVRILLWASLAASAALLAWSLYGRR
jgi:anti-sigma B factor antagonist